MENTDVLPLDHLRGGAARRVQYRRLHAWRGRCWYRCDRDDPRKSGPRLRRLRLRRVLVRRCAVYCRLVGATGRTRRTRTRPWTRT